MGVSCPWENPEGKSRGPVRACVPFQGTEVSYFGKKSLILMVLQILCKSQDYFPGSLLVEND